MKALLLMALVVAYTPMSRAAESSIPCDVADVLAEKAYMRVSSAMSNNQRALALVASQTLWDLREYAPACRQVAARSDDLRASGFDGSSLDPWSQMVLDNVNRNSVKVPITPPKLKLPILRDSPGSGGFIGEYKDPTASGFGFSDNQVFICQMIKRRFSKGSGMWYGYTPPGHSRGEDGASWLRFIDENSSAPGWNERVMNFDKSNPQSWYGSNAGTAGADWGKIPFQARDWYWDEDQRSVLDATEAISGGGIPLRQ